MSPRVRSRLSSPWLRCWLAHHCLYPRNANQPHVGQIKNYTAASGSCVVSAGQRQRGTSVQEASGIENEHLEMNKWWLSANNKAPKKQLQLFPQLFTLTVWSMMLSALWKNIHVYWQGEELEIIQVSALYIQPVKARYQVLSHCVQTGASLLQKRSKCLWQTR